MKIEKKGSIVIYKNNNVDVKLRADVDKNTIWATQEQVAQLFGTQRPAITKHLKNIFSTFELKENSVCSILEHTASDNKVYKVKYFNLDVIIAVGYRVNSKNATKFRIWATKVLREYLVNGYLNMSEDESLSGETNELKGLEHAVSLLRSSRLKGVLKGKLTLKLTKNLK